MKQNESDLVAQLEKRHPELHALLETYVSDLRSQVRRMEIAMKADKPEEVLLQMMAMYGDLGDMLDDIDPPMDEEGIPFEPESSTRMLS